MMDSMGGMGMAGMGLWMLLWAVLSLVILALASFGALSLVRRFTHARSGRVPALPRKRCAVATPPVTSTKTSTSPACPG